MGDLNGSWRKVVVYPFTKEESNQSKMPKSLLSVRIKTWGGFTSSLLQKNSLI